MEGQNPTTGSSDSHLEKQDRRRDMRLMTHGIKSHPPSAPLFVQGDRNNHGPGGKKKGNFPGKLFFIFSSRREISIMSGIGFRLSRAIKPRGITLYVAHSIHLHLVVVNLRNGNFDYF
jgi:hypothetical protein